MKMIKWLAVISLFAVFAPGLVAETPQKHIRVIVDTSASLQTNDPSGYVKLATELFYDLASKEFNVNDTFSVLHFPGAGDAQWSTARTPPSTVNLSSVIALQQHDTASAAKFRQSVRALPYDSRKTFFAPCFQWALDDLKAKSHGRDNRVIMLITDGLSDAESEDAKRLSELTAQLASENIHVFVLAFGNAKQDWFTSALSIGSPSGVSGQVFAGENSSHLLSDMLEIFSRSFGYSREVIYQGQSQGNVSSINVANGQTLQSASVIAVYANQGNSAPDFQLTPPGGHGMGPQTAQTEMALADPNRKATAVPVSYAIQWLNAPQSGSYGFVDHGHRPTELAVLRPIRVKIEFRSHQGKPFELAMGGKPAPMDVLVSPADGAGGDPGPDLKAEYRLHYLQPNDARDSTTSTQSTSVVSSEGRLFTITPEFAATVTGTEPGRSYQAYVEVVVKRFETVVARMSEPQPVTVYPYISVGVTPQKTPLVTKDGNEAIAGREQGCIRGIHFQFNQGKPEVKNFSLSVRVLNPPDLTGAWTGARFSFDGQEFIGPDVLNQTLSASEMDAPHTFCVIAGAPVVGDVQRPLTLHFGLWWDGLDSNLQKLNVVDELETTATIQPPSWWQIAQPWAILLAGILLAGALAWILRSKYALPKDLEVAVAGRGQALGASSALGGNAIFDWLGVPVAHSVYALDGGRELGQVKPVKDGLYLFKASRGLGNVMRSNAQAWDQWTPVPPEIDGSYLLEAGTIYQIGFTEVYRFRIEYKQQRPRP